MYPNSFSRHWQGFLRRFYSNWSCCWAELHLWELFGNILDGKEIFCEGAAPAWRAGEGVECAPLLEQLQSHNSIFFFGGILWSLQCQEALGVSWSTIPLLNTVKTRSLIISSPKIPAEAQLCPRIQVLLGSPPAAFPNSLFFPFLLRLCRAEFTARRVILSVNFFFFY